MSTTKNNRLRRAGAIAGATALSIGLFGFAAPVANANPVTDFSSNLSSQFFPPGPGDDEECPVDAASPEITGNIHQVPAPPAGNEWVYHGDSNYNDCSDLSYATLEVAGGTVSSPNQLMLFHQGEYIGVGALVPQTHRIVDTTERSVTVDYVDWEALYADDGAHADWQSYLVEVTYHWDGEKVVPIGEIPNQNL